MSDLLENPGTEVAEFVVDDKSLTLIVESILTKLKEHGAVLSRSDAESIWDQIVDKVIAGDLGEDKDNVGGKGVPIGMLADIVVKGNFLRFKLVVDSDGEGDIDELVSVPESNVVYLLKGEEEEDGTNATMWMYMADSEDGYYWLNIGGVRVPELEFVDTDDEGVEVANIVSHIDRGDKDYSGSQNVGANDIVTAQALTNVLISLGYTKKVVIDYATNEGKVISEHVPTPLLNTFYVYQMSETDDDWAVYTAIKVGGDSDGKYVWLKLAGGEGTVEVDLSNYWSKNELKIITSDKVTEIFESAVDKILNGED